MFKNMKIEINSEQPLREVIEVIEDLGYEVWGLCSNPKFLVTHKTGEYQTIMNDVPRLVDWKLVSLLDLIEEN